MRWLQRICRLLLGPEMLLKRVVMRMLLYMVVQVVREGRVRMQVVKVVVHRNLPHRVEVEVMVMVGGPMRHDRHRRGALMRGHREQVGSRRLPHPPRRWSSRLPSSLRVLKLPIVHLEVVEQPVEDVSPKGYCARRKLQLHIRRVKRRRVVDQHS